MLEPQRVFGINLNGPLAFSNYTGPLPPPPEFSHVALESRMITGYVSAASALVIILQGVHYLASSARVRQTIANTNYVHSHGGWTILAFQVLRLLSNNVLFVLAIFTAARSDWSSWGDIVVVISSAYVFSLAALLLYVPLSQSAPISFHATFASWGIFGAFCYRDVYPLITFIYDPADASEGWLIWTKVALASVAAVLVPMLEPHMYIPYDPANPQEKANPEQTTSLFGFLSYNFITPIIMQARSVAHLSFAMLPPQLDTDQMHALAPRSSRYLDPFSAPKRKVNVYWGILASFAGSWLLQALLVSLSALATLGSPVGTNRLLLYIEGGGANAIIRPWIWILLIALAPILQNATEQLYLYYNTRTATQIEAVITGVVYQHSLRVRVINKADDEAPPPPAAPLDLPKANTALGPTQAPGSSDSQAVETATVHSRAESSASSTTVVGSDNGKGKKGKDIKDNKKDKSLDIIGKLNNLVTSDLENITGGKDWLLCIVSTLLQATLGSWFLYSILGWAAWVGLAVMLALAPLPAWVSKSMNGLQKKKMQATDRRVKYIKEVLSILRMIKQLGLERQVKREIDAKREEELYWVFRRAIFQLLNMTVNYIIPLVHMVVTFVIYTVVMKQRLTASVVFSALTGFNMLRMSLFMCFFMVPSLIQANVSIGRVQSFLNETELLDRYTNEVVIQDASDQHEDDLGLAQAQFFWSKEHSTDGTLTPSRQRFRLQIEDDVVFKRGVNLIVGPTGSGKSSLLMALLGEMHYVPSGPGAWVNLPKNGGVAYCAQEPWIQSLSIKENILFGAPYDERRYKKVIYQCGLKRDITLFDAGDATEIGEKGLTLSGGQKARISLARAIYSNASTILLDDILAALDVHTSVWIVNKCLKGELVQGRTILLFYKLVIVSQGVPAEVLVVDKVLAEEIAHEQEALEMEEDLEEQSEETKAAAKGSKLIVAEEIQEGHISMKAVKLLVANLSRWPILFWCGYLLGCVTDESLEVFEMWWLGWWAEQYSRYSVVNVAYYLGIYAAIVVLIVLTYIWVSIMSTFASIRVGRIIHDRLTSSVLSTTFRWLDTTPSSRILARCTQDIQSIDGPLVRMSNHFIAMLVMCLSRLVAIMFSAPIFAIPAGVIGVIGAAIGQVYIKAQLSVKRERSNAKAPVLAAINGAFSGLTSIRAYDAQTMFTAQSMEKVDKYTHISIIFWNVNRWVAVRIQLLSGAFAGGLAFYLVYGPGHRTRTASTIGFALNMAVGFSRQILSIVRVWNMLEVEGNSLERIQSYLEIEQEPQATEEGTPPAYWPASGSLRVENLTARYSADGPVVLNNISFEVKAGERVGIVGRTGSGKSTLTLALLRCIFTAGDVYFDGLPTSALNLDALRGNVTIIPQAPELLSGTLRKNLDMFEQYDDAALNDALRSAGLFALQSDADENRLTLDSQIAAGGGNLSVGQRQIIALARAIVRQSKLLVLDEATSAIDYETDTIIQASLRTELKSDVTVLTVAHRLQTVMDSDKIMVLDAGKLIEFDSPKNLLQREDSFLRALVDESADKEALHAMAEGRSSV